MSPTEFAYWLQGFFEITGSSVNNLTAEQVKMMRAHLDLVFQNITQSVASPGYSTFTIDTASLPKFC